jgi:Flp pilus assembly protein TadG
VSTGPVPRRAQDPGERGSAAVEFALVLPLILLMAVAVVQVGVFVKDRLVLQDAARAGAREAAVTMDDSAVRQAVVDAAASLDPDGLDVTISREGGTGTAVTVAVGYHDAVSIDVVAWLFPQNVDLQASVTMRQETG